jgi:hypothetical protein
MSSFKTIAVPPRNASRTRGQDVSGLAGLPPGRSMSSPRADRAGRGHRFAIGQRLAMAAGGRDISRGSSPCSVVALLPHEGGPFRYRVRSDSESFERIVDETDLSELNSSLD